MTAKNQPLTEDQIEEAAKAFVAGETCKSIGLRLDRSESAISGLMNRRGLRRERQVSRHDDPEFLKLRRAGRTAAEIAEAMGVNVKAAEWWIAQALRAGLVQKSKKAFRWPEAQAERLEKMWATMGPAEISQETGWTVKVIQAKARRMGLPHKGYPSVRKSVVGRKMPQRRQTSAEARAAREAARDAAIKARAAEAATMWAPSATSRPFLEREPGQCSWPLGEGAAAHACCAPVEGRDTYCPHHRLLAGGARTDKGYSTPPAFQRRGPATVFDRGRALS